MAQTSKNQKKKTEYFKTTVQLCFDPDFIDCKHCPLLITYSRQTCGLTGELITNDKCVGNWCPFLDEVIEFHIGRKNKDLFADYEAIPFLN